MKRIVIYIFCLVFCFAANATASDIISSINVRVANGSTSRISEDLVKKVIPVKVGDKFDPAKIDQTIDSLRKWGVFENINVSTKSVKDGNELDIVLQEAVMIGEIDIKGNYPYIESKIKKYLTIRPGDIYTRDKIDEQIKRISDFYEREGFYNTKVTAVEEWVESSRDVRVTFKIKCGKLIRYREISVEGSSAYPRGRIVSAINPIKQYRPRKFNDSMRKVTDFYHSHGYPRARIEVYKKEIDVEARRIDVGIKIKEGPRVDVAFEGKKKISTAKLKKAITIYEEGSFDEYELDASKNKLLKLYNEKGYPDPQINVERKYLNDSKVLILFTINAGSKRRIYDVNIEGNDAISDRKIKKGIKTKEVSITEQGIYKKEDLKNDAERIKKIYASQGYLNAEVGELTIEETRNGLDITIPVAEDGRTFTGKIVFSGNGHFKKSVLLKKMQNKVGKPFDSTVFENEKHNLLIFYADHGYPYAEIKDSFEVVDGLAKLKYEIIEGARVKIGQILVVGNSLTTTRSIRKSLGIKEGDPFSYQKITEGQVALRRLGAFNAVSIDTIGLEEKDKVVHLRVKVEEQKPFILDFEVGYSTDDQYMGSVNFTNLNSFGLAKRSTLKLTGGRELSRGEAIWSDPRFLGSDIEFTVSSWLQYEDKNIFNYLQAGEGFGFFRRYHRTGFLARHEIMRNYFVQGDSTAADADSLRDNTISKVALSVSFDTRNNFADPTNGLFLMGNTDFYNEIKGKNANFVKLRFYFGHYFGFLRYFTIANNLRVDRIQTIGDHISIPSNELFQLGGDDTVRGFSEDSLGPVNAAGSPTGGRVRWIYNGELRIKLFRNFKLAGFYDTGALVNEFNDVNLTTVRQSVGVGLRYITPVGPLRFDYGIILDPKKGDHFGRFHLTFGYVF